MATEEPAPTFGGAAYSDKLGTLVGADGSPVELRRQCLEVFHYLAATPDTLVRKEDIVSAVWGQVAVTDDSLTQCISEIRKALGDSERRILKTLPRRGYMLVSDPPANTTAATAATATATDAAAAAAAAGTVKHGKFPQLQKIVTLPRLFASGVLVMLAVAGIPEPADKPVNAQQIDTPALAQSAADDTPTLSLVELSAPGSTTVSSDARILTAELRVALSRYRTMRLVEDVEADYRLTLNIDDLGSQPSRLFAELEHTGDQSILFARAYDVDVAAQPLRDLGVRIAAAVASPGVGAISEHLLESSRLKPIEQITRAECYANGFGCVKCSGEEDNITRRAEACLAYLLERHPEDARAWALQATIHAHQYLWANTLPEPQRSTPALRQHYPQLAVDAANKAEALSDGNDSTIYWGMAEAYFASCQPDKLQVAIERGLAINPDDPNLLAAFGNWLSYSGKWDEGSTLTQRALEIEPVNYRHWWWMGLAKTHYVKREYAQAYDMFLKAFDDRNWLSHLQLAYTLPHLGRVEEAHQSVKRLRDLNPGITLESALEVYRTMCFPDSFLEDMKAGLIAAGLGSRGSSQDFDNLILPRPALVSVDGHTVEYLDVGTGEPVVFVHGKLSDYRTWGFYLLPISERHRFISYSRRYYGTQPWPDDMAPYSQSDYARELIGLIEGLELGPVHVVSWSSGVRSAMRAVAERPDLFRSAIHYEPVDNGVFDGDASITALQSAWSARWQSFGDALSANDLERAGELLIENVFELPAGGYAQERELHKEVVRQNARTLPLEEVRSAEDPLMNCGWLARVSVPTHFVGGADTHEYWKRMTRRFAECTPGSTLEFIADTRHDGAVDKVDELSAIILGFVDAHR